jgi:hypothetical protein
MDGRSLIERSQALRFLRRAVADPKAEFRYSQWEAIDAVVNRRKKLLLVERTSWGKGIVFIATRGPARAPRRTPHAYRIAAAGADAQSDRGRRAPRHSGPLDQFHQP